MSMDKGSMIGTPVCHHTVYITECTFACRTWYKPGCRPGRIGPVINLLMHILRQRNALSFCNLHHRSHAFYQVHTNHRKRHFRIGLKVGRISTTTELAKLCRTPACCRKAGFDIFLRHLPPWLHHRISLCILTLTGCIQTG